MTSFSDMTERQRWADVFQATETGLAICSGAGTTLELVNPAFARMHGYTVEELSGRPTADVFTPEQRAALDEHIRLTYERGHHTYESEHMRKDGSRFPALIDATAVKSATGRVLYRIVNVTDISERKRMEETLEERARQQAAVAELGRRALEDPDVGQLLNEVASVTASTLHVEYCKVLELTADGEALVLRAALGYEAEHVGRATFGAGCESQAGYTLLAGEPVISVNLQAETRFEVPALLRSHGEVSTMSVAIPGSPRPFGVLQADSVRQRPFSADDANFLRAVANVLASAIRRRDFEERLAREQAEAERLGELDRLRREFISTISHDLRTPITAGRVSLGLLETSTRDRLRPDEHKLLENALRDIERLNMQVDDLLALNQIEAGVFHLDCEPLDLRRVVVNATTQVFPLLGEKGQQLELDLPVALPTVGDARRLEQVLVNLLDNAHRHTPHGTRIMLSARATADEICLSVRDNGPGIAREELETIFQRFHRASTETDGSGLGLAIAKALIERHSGRIWAESEAGHGACFHVRLPAGERSTGE